MVLMKIRSESESFHVSMFLLLCFGLLLVCGCNSAEKEYRPIAKPNDGRFEVRSFTINGVGQDDEVVVKLGSQMEVRLDFVNKSQPVGISPSFRFYTQHQKDRGNILRGSTGVIMQSGRVDQPFSKGKMNYRFNITVPNNDDLVKSCEKLHGGKFIFFAITHQGYLIASRRINFTE